MRKNHSKLRKVLPLVLSLAAAGAGTVSAQSVEKPQVLENFDYASHRKGYEGKIFNYNLLSNFIISQSNKRGVNILPIWFYDIDKDGKFGKAEIAARKAGIPIFMHQAFNDTANKRVRKLLEAAVEYSSLTEKLKEEQENSKTYQKKINELEKKIIEYQSQIQKEAPKAESYKEGYELPLPKAEREKEAKRTLYAQLSTVEMEEKEESYGLDYNLPLPQVEEKVAPRGIITATKEMPEACLQAPIYSEEKELPLPKTPKLPKEKKTREYRESREEKENREEQKGYFSLLAQATSNSTLDDYSASLGARYNFNKHLGIGANLDLGYGLDNLVDIYTAPLSAGRIASGKTIDTDKTSIGASLEAQLGPFVLGAGVDYKKWIANTTEQILDSTGSVVKSNANSVQNRQAFAKVYGGLEVPLTQNWKIGAVGGYSWKDGAYAGLRTVIKLNKRKR